MLSELRQIKQKEEHKNSTLKLFGEKIATENFHSYKKMPPYASWHKNPIEEKRMRDTDKVK